MDYEEQRRLYTLNMAPHPMVGHHQAPQQPVQVSQQQQQVVQHQQAAAVAAQQAVAQQQQQVVVQQQQQVSAAGPHTRMLMPEVSLAMVIGGRGDHLDSLTATMATAQHLHPTVAQLPHHQHQQPLTQHQVAQQQQQQQLEGLEVTLVDGGGGGEACTLVGVLENPATKPGEGVEGQQAGAEEAPGWCLVCNKTVTQQESPQGWVELHKATMTVSQRRLSAMLGRLVGLVLPRAHSDLLCSRCFGLVDQVDGLEIELADTKMELVQRYEATVAQRQPQAKQDIQRPTLEVDVAWEESEESEALDNGDDDPDCTKRRKKTKRTTKKKGGRPRKVKLTTKIKLASAAEIGEEGEEGPRKRGRGRPRKKDKEEDEFVPPGAPTKDCPTCKKVIHAKKFLLHLSTHRLFPCPFCAVVFKRKDIKTHLAEAHQEEIHYPCPECELVFDSFMQLRQHCLLVHLGVQRQQFLCKVCNKKFSSMTGLKVHVETIHEKTQEYQCPECKEVFNQKGNMQNHLRRVHQGEEARKLTCDLCHKGFICPSDLRKHVERVHLKVRKNEVICEVCAKPFSDSRAMRIHVNAVHTRAVQHPCPECKMVFHSLTNMVTHRRRMHGGAQGRRNLCQVCGKGFCSPSDLKTHVRVVHDNVRKYVCDVCGQAFKVCSHLKYHRRKHTGETPYECPHCGKCFHGPSHISDHVKKVHKTVYIGTNQRRKLNLPDSAPPPPPGMLPPRHAKPKSKPASPPVPLVHASYPQPCPAPVSTVTTFPQPSHHPTVLPPSQPPPPMLPPQPVMDHHHPYTNFQFQTVEQPPNQGSPVPMVVRLLHDLQYQ